MSNSIIDLVIRIKNGYAARRDQIDSPHSNFREEVLKKLESLGYIKKYTVSGDVVKSIDITLSYENNMPAVVDVKLFSKPGRRWYTGAKKLKPVLGGMGVGILSTPKGIMTNKEARQKKIGGELLFEIW
jgi:small subunit ribosomal protein S8